MVLFELGKPKHKYINKEGAIRIWQLNLDKIENLEIKEKVKICLKVRKRTLCWKTFYWCLAIATLITFIIPVCLEAFAKVHHLAFDILFLVPAFLMLELVIFYPEAKEEIFNDMISEESSQEFLKIALTVVTEEWLEENVLVKHIKTSERRQSKGLKYWPLISWFPRNFAKAMNEIIYLVANEIYLENPSDELPNWRIYRKNKK